MSWYFTVSSRLPNLPFSALFSISNPKGYMSKFVKLSSIVLLTFVGVRYSDSGACKDFFIDSDLNLRLTDTGLSCALRAMRIFALEFLSKNEKRSRKRHGAKCPRKGHTVLWPTIFFVPVSVKTTLVLIRKFEPFVGYSWEKIGFAKANRRTRIRNHKIIRDYTTPKRLIDIKINQFLF